jgi:hypothetical protein
MLQVNTKVVWTSQSSGYRKTKVGIIVAVVPPGVDPTTCIPPGYRMLNKEPGAPRKIESYLVRVGNSRKLYWPLVNKLKKVKESPSILTSPNSKSIEPSNSNDA